MKVMLGQINTTPRDFDGNAAKIIAGIKSAIHSNCDLVIFPELAIPGYLSRDLIYFDDYIENSLDTLNSITAATLNSSITVVVGYVDRNHNGSGKPVSNMAAVIKNGLIIARYQKQLLPFYDVFDEARYFAPGNSPVVVKIDNQKWGLLICEDLWLDKGMDDFNYHSSLSPLQAYRDIGVKNFIAINSSPFVEGKPSARIEMVKNSSRGGATIIYVNQVGGQDELVFDGSSFIVHDGELCYKTESFKETLAAVELPLHAIDYHQHNCTSDIFDALVLGLKDYIRKSGFKSVVLGSSGGIDSAVVAALACQAIGPENVHCIRMPSVFSSEGSKDDALKLHENLGCHDYLIPIDHQPFLETIQAGFAKVDSQYNKVADENLQARMRGQIVMHFSNAFGALPLTTGNKTELALGYCTLYGDMNGGFAPINDLYKLEVYALAKYINKGGLGGIIPAEIISKAPSAELAPDQTDEASLLPYVILDPIVKAYIEDYIGTFEEFKQQLYQKGFNPLVSPPIAEWLTTPNAEKDYNKMINLIDKSEFKRRQAAPGIKKSRVAFGSGRRLPICKGNN